VEGDEGESRPGRGGKRRVPVVRESGWDSKGKKKWYSNLEGKGGDLPLGVGALDASFCALSRRCLVNRKSSRKDS